MNAVLPVTRADIDELLYKMGAASVIWIGCQDTQDFGIQISQLGVTTAEFAQAAVEPRRSANSKPGRHTF
jgi:hypothetical protein